MEQVSVPTTPGDAVPKPDSRIAFEHGSMRVGAGALPLYVCFLRDEEVVVTVGPVAGATWLPEGIVVQRLVEIDGERVASHEHTWIVRPDEASLEAIAAYHAALIPWRDGDPDRADRLLDADRAALVRAVQDLWLRSRDEVFDRAVPSPPGGIWRAEPSMGRFAGDLFTGYETRVGGIALNPFNAEG